jgi:hypothetical protein
MVHGGIPVASRSAVLSWLASNSTTFAVKWSPALGRVQAAFTSSVLKTSVGLIRAMSPSPRTRGRVSGHESRPGGAELDVSYNSVRMVQQTALQWVAAALVAAQLRPPAPWRVVPGGVRARVAPASLHAPRGAYGIDGRRIAGHAIAAQSAARKMVVHGPVVGRRAEARHE